MKEQPKKDIQFRRIRGRIVPIKVTKKNKEIARGSSYVLAGLGISAIGSGVGAVLLGKAAKQGTELKKFHKTSMWLANSDHQTALGNKVSDILAVGGAKRGLAAKKLTKIARNIHRGGLIACTYFAAAGINDLLRQNKKYEPNVAKDFASDIGTAGALWASNLGFRKIASRTNLFKAINTLRFFK